MTYEEMAEEWVKENMDCVRDGNYFTDEERSVAKSAFKAGAEFGYNKANEWHNLQENPTDLPRCEENEQIIFYVKEWIESIQKYRTHYCLGFYKKAFLIGEVKLFVEKSKGYENEHFPESVLRWRELEKWE